ncbi:glycosyltransferase family 2 protein [Vibrio cholerae]|uniref:glycosyltransferase family A protein n=1 Tax=Vibrio cholerae TaxID=666 RepID=UPI0006E590CE|nr:glycosyltransferase family 2 protein [Vibrio cholerae]EHY0936297.1 glycosyltransferase [Vibrio cholerae]EJL6615623.1 glycosyltransferase [Vibrio cholerae]KQA49452.1 hypothetical protein XV77_11785 [Vibrio cholerae]PAS07949.1 glycosyltransferase family 2 protein [Vibrio cholerae]PAS15295.1 glycosyltransferase family 2 protein [Vibrio cholerae]
MNCLFVIPVFNRVDKIKNIIKNTFLMKNFSFLFIDDHSTDGTYDYLVELSIKFEKVKVIRTSREDSFWYGAIYDGIKHICEEDLISDYSFFGFMNDDVEVVNAVEKMNFSLMNSNEIYFAPAYWKRKGIYTGGEKNGEFITSKNKLDILNVDYDSVGGFFTIFPIDCAKKIYNQKLPSIIKHYHADMLITLNLSRSGFMIKSLNNIEVIIDDSDKNRLASMKFTKRLIDVRSPYEWRSSLYWYLISKNSFRHFILKSSLHFSKAIFFGLYYKCGKKI